MTPFLSGSNSLNLILIHRSTVNEFLIYFFFPVLVTALCKLFACQANSNLLYFLRVVETDDTHQLIFHSHIRNIPLACALCLSVSPLKMYCMPVSSDG